MGTTGKIADFVVKTSSADIPPDLYDHAKTAFLDWFGVLIAGKDEPLVLKLLDQAKLMGGHAQATLVGHALKTNVSQAALINGSASHALDYDDGMPAFRGHPSVTLFPALVALSEWKEKSGKDLLTAYLVGIEAGAAVGDCAGSKHYGAGWHGTSTIGRLASAAACAKLLDLDELQTRYALGIAGTQTAGLQRVFGTMCKPFHAGKASQVGLEASLLARDNFTSAEDILEGREGFFQVLGGQENGDIVNSLGKRWNIDTLIQKYHASCQCTHSPIDAAVNIVKENLLSLHEIRSIRIHTPQQCINIAGKTELASGLEGKFSMVYCVANALLRGNTGEKAFTDEKVMDPEIREFMQRISMKADPEISGVAARVEVETDSGRVLEEVNNSLAPMALSVKKQKVTKKFMDLCGPIMGKSKADTAMKAILSLDRAGNIKDLVAQLSV